MIIIKSLHHCPAQERNTNHEHPARDDSEDPKDIADRDGKAVLGKGAIEWVEKSVIDLNTLLSLSRIEICKGLDGSIRGIQRLDSDINWGWGCDDVKDPESRRSSTPGVAENRLVFTVEEAKVRSCRIDGP